MKSKIYKNIAILSLILTMLAVFAACNKDLGNYNYTELNAVDTVYDLRDTTVLYNSRFQLAPKLSFTLDPTASPDDYTYEWVYFTGVKDEDKIAISTERAIDYEVRLSPGTRVIYYAVKNKKTGIEKRFSFRLTVVNEINEGWMFLTEVNDVARVDMLSLHTTGTKFDLIKDLLATTKSDLHLTGKPRSLYGYTSGLATSLGANFSYALYINTTENGFRLEPNTFAWQSNYTLSKEMIGAPDKVSADVIKRNSSNRAYMISGGNLYLFDRVNQLRFGIELNLIALKNQSFKVAPFIASNESTTSSTAAIFFDDTYKRFVKHTGTAASCTEIPDPTNKLFSFQIDKNLLYMTRTPYNSGEVFSVLQDLQSPKRYIARFNPVNNAQAFFEEIKIPDFDKAENFAVSPVYGYLFYSIGSKVYEYDMFAKTTKVMADYGNQKITILRFYSFQNATKYTGEKDLIVCTYDESKPVGEGGKMDIYDVPGLNAQITLKNSYSGFGKVQSLMYRER